MPRNVKISRIRPFMKGLNLKVKILKVLGTKEVYSRKTGMNHKVMEVVVGDETGQIGLSIWDDRIIELEEGKTYNITNAYASKFKGRVILNLGKYGEIKEVEEKSEAQ